MNPSKIERDINDFLNQYQSTLYQVVKNHNNLFEVSCYVLYAKYYENIGYHLKINNSINGKFRFRFSTNGVPWRYSYITGFNNEKSEPVFEIWHNQKVTGYWDDLEKNDDAATFALDIAVVKPNSLPSNLQFNTPSKGIRVSVKNEDLISFGEAKKLAAYPMLIAQFIGVVHEIKPDFLHEKKKKNKSEFYEKKHLPPILFTSGNLSSGANKVISSMKKRGIEIIVLENLGIIDFSESILKLTENYKFSDLSKNRIQTKHLVRDN
jgi:hypothetical protein